MDTAVCRFGRGAMIICILGSIAIYAQPTLTKVWSKKPGGGSENGEISPDGKYVAVAVEANSTTGEIHILQASNGDFVKKLTFIKGCSGEKCNEVESMAWSGDGKFIAAGGNGTGAKVINIETGAEVFFQKTRETDGTGGHPNGTMFAMGNSGSLMIVKRNGSTYALDQTLSAHSCGINSVNFTPDGKYMATGACDKKSILWEVNGFKKLITTSNPNSVKTVRITPDGKYFITATGDAHTVVVWSSSGTKVASVELSPYVGSVSQKYVDHAELSPDGKYFVTQAKGKDVLLFSMPDAKFVKRFSSAGNGEYMHWKNSQLLVCSSDGLVTMFKSSGGGSTTTANRFPLQTERLQIAASADHKNAYFNLSGSFLSGKSLGGIVVVKKYGKGDRMGIVIDK